jgi:hypothetical protein
MKKKEKRICNKIDIYTKNKLVYLLLSFVGECSHAAHEINKERDNTARNRSLTKRNCKFDPNSSQQFHKIKDLPVANVDVVSVLMLCVENK